MTIAEANVRLQIALPQGWTKEDIENELNDWLMEVQERLHDERTVLVEFDTTVLHVDADPLQTSKLRQLPTRLPLAMR